MMVASEVKAMGYISAATYAAKYGCSVSAAKEQGRRGKLKSITFAKVGEPLGKGEYTFLEDRLALIQRAHDVRRGDEKQCSACYTWLKASDYSPASWRRDKGVCRMCSTTQRRARDFPSKANDLDIKIIKGNKLDEMERQHVLTEVQRQKRERRVQEHAARIEAAGLAGDGKDWIE